MLPPSPTSAGFGILLLTGIVAPLVGFLLRSTSEGWDEIGGGPFAMEHQTPVQGLSAADGEARDAEARIDAELRAEVRQLVIVRNERRMHRGLEPLDVEAETERQLEDFIGSRP